MGKEARRAIRDLRNTEQWLELRAARSDLKALATSGVITGDEYKRRLAALPQTLAGLR